MYRKGFTDKVDSTSILVCRHLTIFTNRYSVFPHDLIPEEKKNIQEEMGSNPGPLLCTAHTLTTRPEKPFLMCIIHCVDNVFLEFDNVHKTLNFFECPNPF